MENILVLDSGIGGLYTANVLKEKHPNFNYIYLKDSCNCPYGNKNKEELLNIALNNINFVLTRFKIKAIVLACNTLSTNCFDELKSSYNLPFFKVEPPLNKITKSAIILCTKTCYNALKMGKNGIEQNFSEISVFDTIINNQKTTICAMYNLAFLIEQNINNKQLLHEYLQKVLQPIKTEQYYQIVLGCTHYNFIKDELKDLFSNCDFLEGSNLINLNVL